MPTRKAFLAALNRYPNPANNLPSCVADAEAFKGKLRSTYGFTAIRTIYDEQATVANVEAGIDWLFSGAGPDDRLVFFFSGHGFQVLEGDNLEEVLCCYDGFMYDNKLSEASQALPPGIFTCIFDSCHSGGMYKLVHLDAPNDYEIAQTKVLKFPPETEKLYVSEARVRRLQYKPFGARADDEAAIAKRFAPTPVGKSASDEVGQLVMNGLLISASLENETAAASTPRTQGKSAMTFAMLDQLEALGPSITNREMVEAMERKLREFSFRQTPMLMQGTRSGNLGNQPFLLIDSTPTGPTRDQPLDLQSIMDRIKDALGLTAKGKQPTDQPTKGYEAMPEKTDQPTKEYEAMTEKTDYPTPSGEKAPEADLSPEEKAYEDQTVVAMEAVLAVTQHLQAQGIEPQKDFGATPEDQDKWWNLVVPIATAAFEALWTGDYLPQKAPAEAEMPLLNAVQRAVEATVPMIWSEIAAQGLEPTKEFGADEGNFWSEIAQKMRTAVQVAVEALSKQGAAPKGFESVPTDDNAWWKAFGDVYEATTEEALRELSKSGMVPRKDLAGADKGWFGTVVSAAITIAQVYSSAQRSKEIDVEKDFGAEKGWWRRRARRVLRRLGRAALRYLTKSAVMPSGSDKGFEKPMSAQQPMLPEEGEGKGLGNWINRIVTPTLPLIVQALQNL